MEGTIETNQDEATPIRADGRVETDANNNDPEDSSKSLFTKPMRSEQQQSHKQGEQIKDAEPQQQQQKQQRGLGNKLEQTKSSGEARTTTVSAPQPIGRFIAIHLFGAIETGLFQSVNDVYIKYSIVSGPDWILAAGSDVGITQISRFNSNNNQYSQRRVLSNKWREFVWNHPISLSYKSYNYYGWPQIVLSVYDFDTFGNDRILGYGATHLPVSGQLPSDFKQEVEIYAPQSSSLAKQILSWLTGKQPELVDSALFARADCRRVLQVLRVGHVELKFNLTTKDVLDNGYRS